MLLTRNQLQKFYLRDLTVSTVNIRRRLDIPLLREKDGESSECKSIKSCNEKDLSKVYFYCVRSNKS